MQGRVPTGTWSGAKGGHRGENRKGISRGNCFVGGQCCRGAAASRIANHASGIASQRTGQDRSQARHGRAKSHSRACKSDSDARFVAESDANSNTDADPVFHADANANTAATHTNSNASPASPAASATPRPVAHAGYSDR